MTNQEEETLREIGNHLESKTLELNYLTVTLMIKDAVMLGSQGEIFMNEAGIRSDDLALKIMAKAVESVVDKYVPDLRSLVGCECDDCKKDRS